MADDKIERRHHGLCSGLEVGNVFTEQRRQPWVHFKIGVPHIPIQNTPSDTVMGAGAKPKDIPHGTYAVLNVDQQPALFSCISSSSAGRPVITQSNISKQRQRRDWHYFSAVSSSGR